MSEVNYFFDIHCHALNFSHPNLFAFFKRKWTIALLASPLAPVATTFLREKVKKIENLFSLMENDIGDFLLITEYFLKDWLKNSPLTIGKTIFSKIVLTPLMMDFGYKGLKANCFYNITPQKPIADQVIDLFNGIKKYCQNELILEKGKVQSVPQTKPNKLFEIYPFLGINTQNYTVQEIETLLNKYFDNYSHHHPSLYAQMGEFNGNIEEMGSNFFAGVKVYPPLGFDPWPERDSEEMVKVKYLYEYCCAKEIPITTHCSEGGFTIDENAKDYTSPLKWEVVLSNYKNLKLNFAHFGRQDKKLGLIPNREWETIILNLISSYDQVYTDFSYRGINDEYYNELNKLINRHPNKDKIKLRILFGSDFMINLLDINSYNDYLKKFIASPLADSDKILFSAINPNRFLFGPEKK